MKYPRDHFSLFSNALFAGAVFATAMGLFSYWSKPVSAFAAIQSTTEAGQLDQTSRQDQVIRNADVPSAELQQTASKTEVQIAEPFTIRLDVTYDSDQQVQLLPFPDTLGPFVVIGTEQEVDLPLGGSPQQRQTVFHIQLEAWEPGRHQLPGIPIRVTAKTESNNDLSSSKSESTNQQAFSDGSADESNIVVSNPMMISVLEVQSVTDSSQLQAMADLQDAVRLQEENGGMLRQALIVTSVAGVAAAFLAIAFWVGRRKGKTVSLSDWAIQRLRELKSGNPDSADPVAFEDVDEEVDDDTQRLSQASSIVRDYLNLRYGLTANIGTVPETLEQLRNRNWPNHYLGRLETWLRNAESASFAGLRFASQEVDNAIQQGIELIAVAEKLDEDHSSGINTDAENTTVKNLSGGEH